MERIELAAVRYLDGALFTGRRHSFCLAQTRRIDLPELGFVTSTGRFVSRQEAGRIAYGAGQISEPTQRLESEQIIE